MYHVSQTLAPRYDWWLHAILGEVDPSRIERLSLWAPPPWGFVSLLAASLLDGAFVHFCCKRNVHGFGYTLVAHKRGGVGNVAKI